MHESKVKLLKQITDLEEVRKLKEDNNTQLDSTSTKEYKDLKERSNLLIDSLNQKIIYLKSEVKVLRKPTPQQAHIYEAVTRSPDPQRVDSAVIKKLIHTNGVSVDDVIKLKQNGLI
jgi:hypothetical protein